MKSVRAKKILSTTFVAALLFTLPSPAWAFQQTDEDFKLSSGVNYSRYTYSNASSINHVKVDLSDPYTKLDIGLPEPLHKVQTTTYMANRDSREGNRVVGAVNASFFDMAGNDLPLYLISKGNNIINGGVISQSSANYVSRPYAFGVTQNGMAEIDLFNFKVNLNYNNETVELTGLNRQRQGNEAIIFTPQHLTSTTESNSYGMEFVVDTGSVISETKYGQTLTGKVTKIRDYGSKETVTIPKTAFVLSVHGDYVNKYKNLKIGDQLSVSFSIDDKWMNSQFMLASGPMLLKDGKPFITMDTNSSKAKEMTARTAIAISKDKKEVHFVTVDKRTGFSKGMTLTQFATYLQKLGFDRAINFDGGGSTTLGIREYGSNDVVLANRTVYGSQRKVSAIVEAISTAPTSTPKHLKISRDRVGTLLVGAKVNVGVDYVLDGFYNPLNPSSQTLSLESQNNRVNISGASYTGKSAGTDRIIANIGEATSTFSIDVVDAPASLSISPSKTSVNPNESVKYSVTAKDAAGKNLIYNADQVKWSVDGNIGTISSSGSFKASSKPGKGRVIATLGTKSASIPVEVTGTGAVQKDVTSLNGFESPSDWKANGTDATATIGLSASPNPVKQGKYSLRVKYNMTGTGTSAVYVNSIKPIDLPAVPEKIGVWVFGDGSQHWLRGTIFDSAGKSHIIDFTESGGFNWTGWKYVEAKVPASIAGPITLKNIYFAQPNNSLKKSGEIYLDKLQAIYNPNYVEPAFNDISNGNVYNKEIRYLTDRGYINGYLDGTFKPSSTISREHAAVLLSRALGLNLSKVSGQKFSDVPVTHRYYKEITAIAEAGYVGGKGDGTYDPTGSLTRAQMAAILVNAYNMTGSGTKTFKDVSKDHWAYNAINTFAYNDITTGYEDGTFKPGLAVSRAHFSVFLYRSIMNKEGTL